MFTPEVLDNLDKQLERDTFKKHYEMRERRDFKDESIGDYLCVHWADDIFVHGILPLRKRTLMRTSYMNTLLSTEQAYLDMILPMLTSIEKTRKEVEGGL